MSQRLSNCFASLKKYNKAAFIPFLMGGDPDFDQSLSFLQQLPEAGADIIEIGMPFSDPMADGPVIEAAGNRALDAGMKVRRLLELVRTFRTQNDHTPIILMGYYNPIYRYGVAQFAMDAANAGVDGLIIVDLPPEEENEITGELSSNSLDLIRLIAPTTPHERQIYVTEHASGFVYYISVKGITGGSTASSDDLSTAVARIRQNTDLPIAIGFGIKTAQQAKDAAQYGDAVVVGSALVNSFHENGLDAAITLARDIATAIKS